MTGQTGPTSVGPREAPRGVDLSPTKDGSLLVLANPSEAAISWALLHQPYELSPRWGATLTLQPKAGSPEGQRFGQDGVSITASVEHDYFRGHLIFSGLDLEDADLSREIIPEREVEMVLSRRMPDRIAFLDSAGANIERGDSYKEFVERWLPVLWREGYKVRDARLVNLFSNRNRSIYDDNVVILSGVDITREAITMYPLDDKRETEKFPFLLDGDKARKWFAALKQIEALARQ